MQNVNVRKIECVLFTTLWGSKTLFVNKAAGKTMDAIENSKKKKTWNMYWKCFLKKQGKYVY